MGKLRLPGTVDETLGALVGGLAAGRMIRVVNFHATPRYRADQYRRQIEAYARLFAPITPETFGQAFDGTWADPRPGLMPVLFEGFRDNVDVMLPILEEFGFKGWFFMPSAFLAVGLPFGMKPWYRTRIAIPASVMIAAVGAWWTFERVFL